MIAVLEILFLGVIIIALSVIAIQLENIRLALDKAIAKMEGKQHDDRG